MANTTNFGWETPDDTDLVKDGALAMRTLGNAIDTSLVDLKGGTTGQVLSKNTNTDMDFTWITQNDADAIQNSIVDAKGDLISATADNTPARLASSGVNGQVLTIDTSTSTGLKWATPAGGGKVLQVVQGTITTQQSTTSGSFVDTGLTASITPSSTASKVYIVVSFTGEVIKSGSSTTNYGVFNLVRTSTQLQRHPFGNVNYASASNNSFFGPISFSYLDSPSTTSSTTYKVQFRIDSCTTVYMNNTNSTEIASIVLMEIGA